MVAAGSGKRARRNRYIRDTYNSCLPPRPTVSPISPPSPEPLSFCRCNLSPLITRSRKFVHISVSRPPTPLCSRSAPRYSPPPPPTAVSSTVRLVLRATSSTALPLNFKEQAGRERKEGMQRRSREKSARHLRSLIYREMENTRSREKNRRSELRRLCNYD